MAGRIFINYRRDDSIGTAGRLHDRLAQSFGRKNLFMDVDNIPAGVDFVEHLNAQVGACDVLLAIIGTKWLEAKDDSGCRRLDNPNDFVIVEIAAALHRDIRVIPVLVDGAPLPTADEMPEPLKPLVRRNAVEVRNTQFGRDAEGLVEKIRETLRAGKARSYWGVVAGIVALLFLAGGSVLFQGAPPRVQTTLPVSSPRANGASATHEVSSLHDRLADGQPCPTCPEMIVVPSGAFTMGSPFDEDGRYENEAPPHRVAIANSFAVARFPVTRGEFAAFINETGYNAKAGCNSNNMIGSGWKVQENFSWRSPGFAQDDTHPVVCVNWHDSKAFVAWISQKTGKQYRLLTEAEREYSARAGTTIRCYFGNDERDYCSYGNGADLTARKANPGWTVLPCDDGFAYTSPVGSFVPNAFGLYDILGNVWQWVEDCHNNSYTAAPLDGSAWRSGDCSRRVARGGSWLTIPRDRRTASRASFAADLRLNHTGFRLARDLETR
jgi:formylglycine-generating enzyme